MKKLLYILLFFAIPVHAQESKQPFKGASQIILKTEESPEDAYKKIAQHLVMKGYAITNSNSELLALQTSPKSVGNFAFYNRVDMSINLIVAHEFNESRIIITGQLDYEIEAGEHLKDNGTGQVANVGKIGKTAFQQMDELIKGFGFGEISYH